MYLHQDKIERNEKTQILLQQKRLSELTKQFIYLNFYFLNKT